MSILDDITNEKADWYKRQVHGLLMIVNDGDDPMHRSYLQEKLMRILSGAGIGFHPLINRQLDELYGCGRPPLGDDPRQMEMFKEEE